MDVIKLYTIGFTGKNAEIFFGLLNEHGIKKIIDTRINNTSQLAGFAKGSDLKFFAGAIGNIGYEHRIDFAPTKELLSRYRDKKMGWEEYENEYLQLLKGRDLNDDIRSLHRSCLLCSEHLPDRCHRRLLADYLKSLSELPVEIIHLI